MCCGICPTCEHVTDLTLSVRDKTGELYTFNGTLYVSQAWNSNELKEKNTFLYTSTMSLAMCYRLHLLLRHWNIMQMSQTLNLVWKITDLKVNETAFLITQENDHYWLIAKKYKEAKKKVNWCVGGSSFSFSWNGWSAFWKYFQPVSLPPANDLNQKLQNFKRFLHLLLQNVIQLTGCFPYDNQVSDAEFQITITVTIRQQLLLQTHHSTMHSRNVAAKPFDVENQERWQKRSFKKISSLTSDLN